MHRCTSMFTDGPTQVYASFPLAVGDEKECPTRVGLSRSDAKGNRDSVSYSVSRG